MITQDEKLLVYLMNLLDMSRLVLVIFSSAFVQSCCSVSFSDTYAAEMAPIIELIVNKSVQIISSINNEACVAQLGLFSGNLENSTGDSNWALQMLDASAKIPPGLLDFNIAWLGQFDECLKIESVLTNVKGKYCLATFSMGGNSTGVENATQEMQPLVIDDDFFGFSGLKNCLKNPFFRNYVTSSLGFQQVSGDAIELSLKPAVYTTEFPNEHTYQNEANKKSTTVENIHLWDSPFVGLCIPDQCTDIDVETIISSEIPFSHWNITCQTKESINAPFDEGAILTLIFFGFFICIMALSTIYDVIQNKDGRSFHPLLIAFSVNTNGRKLFRIRKNPDEFSALNGLRFLSMVWVVYFHVFYISSWAPLVNTIDVLNFFSETKSMIITNAPFSVDTFFVITGMLVVYNFMKMVHQGHKFNILVFYLHRYIRLTPAIIPVILVTIYLTKYLGSGPFYPQIDAAMVQPCKASWWGALLYVQNYVGLDLCITQTWYLSIDWQLYVLAPTFLLFLPKFPKIGLTIMMCALISCMTAGFMITWQKNLGTHHANSNSMTTDYNKYYYYATHTRASTWIIGGFLGYIFAKIKLGCGGNTLKLPRGLVYAIWIIVLAAIPVCIFAGHDTFNSSEYHQYSNAFFNSFARPAWALCISWIILACTFGYGGLINSILSCPVFQVLNRFTYSIYLLHVTIICLVVLSQRVPGYFSMFHVGYTFWGIFAFSFGLSIFWVLAFETPVIVIEKYLLENKGKRPEEKEVKNGTETTNL